MKTKTANYGTKITEKELMSQVKDLAKLFGWLYYHTWRSIHSPRGLPDLILARPPRLIFAELKTEKGRLSPEQQVWMELLKQCLGVECYLWRPSDIEGIAEILQGTM